jgi:hypothetical protein
MTYQQIQAALKTARDNGQIEPGFKLNGTKASLQARYDALQAQQIAQPTDSRESAPSLPEAIVVPFTDVKVKLQWHPVIYWLGDVVYGAFTHGITALGISQWFVCAHTTSIKPSEICARLRDIAGGTWLSHNLPYLGDGFMFFSCVG